MAREYGDLAAQVRAAFATRVRDRRRPGAERRDHDYALALQWALLPTPSSASARASGSPTWSATPGFRISTGFVGTPLMADALADTGHPDLAYRLLLQTGCPSWLYAVTMGATTVWERWDSMLPDGSINPAR